MTAEKYQNYYPVLDGLRAVAIGLVLLHHFGGYLAEKTGDTGYYGVDLFFVISGYLITSILFRSSGNFSVAYKTFLGRRTLRIFPVYYAALGVMYVANVGTTRDNIAYLLTYTWNYAKGSWHGSEIHYVWSLCVEEQFYLFWPFVVLCLRGRHRLMLASTLFIISVGYAQLMANIFPALAPYNYTGLINRMGSLGIGAFGAIAVCSIRLPRWVSHNLLTEVVVIGILAWTLVTTEKLRFPLMGICSLILVLKATEGRFLIPGLDYLLRHRFTQHVGRVSYGIYVFHIPVAVLLGRYMVEPLWQSIPFDEFGPLNVVRWHSWLIKLPLYSLVTLLLATYSFRWFERPILAKKDVWFPSTSAGAA